MDRDFGGSGSTARVVGQWSYDAYGAVLSADHLYPMALPHLGHKGLFLDRLDVGIVTGPTGPESPRLVPYAHSLYHNRNRAYSPALGRFFQRDPNATAMSLLSMSSTDFLCFQNLFAAGDPGADCDEDGDLTFFDFLCFQNDFAAGCP